MRSILYPPQLIAWLSWAESKGILLLVQVGMKLVPKWQPHKPGMLPSSLC